MAKLYIVDDRPLIIQTLHSRKLITDATIAILNRILECTPMLL